MPRPHPIILCVLLLLAGCGAPSDRSTLSEFGPPVATVGGEPIYARDFVLNYELGFPHLRRGANPRLGYLERMIDEKLLALEGYRLELDREPAVQRRLEDLRVELLVEEVFLRYVNDEVEVSDEEIRTAAQKDRVSFKLRYLPLRTLGRAHTARARALEIGFERVIGDFSASQRDVPLRPDDLESPYLTWRDINPRLLSAIEDLEVGEVSQPVLYHGTYLLLQVLDVRQEPTGRVVSDEERSRYEQVVFQRKARTKAREFIGSMMKPLNVRMKPVPYVALRNNLWRWHQVAPPQENLLRALESVDAPYADSIRTMLDEILITTNEGDWTVRQFLEQYPIERYPLRFRRAEDFESDLYDAIGLMLRDRAFVARAASEGLDRAAAVKHDLRLWSDKWVYRALLERINGSGGSIEERLEELRDRYRIEIRHSVLDTLDLPNPQSPGLTLFKGHTMRPAFPVADAAW